MATSRSKLQELSVFAIYQYLFYYEYEQRPGLKEIIEGSEIGNKFKCIFASEFG